MARVFSECSACGIQSTDENDVRIKYATTVGLMLCFQRPGQKSCSEKVEDAVKEWAENQGQQKLGDFC